MTDNKTFCPMPWYHVASNPDGSMRACCASPTTQYKFGKHKIREFWNSDYMKNMRVKMLNDEWPDACYRCKDDEARKVRSHREIFLETARQDMKKFYLIWNRRKKTQKDGYLEDDPVYFDMKFGNLCNLKCRMCSPLSSSLFFKEMQDNMSEKFPEFMLLEYKRTEKYKQWYEGDEFGEDFNDLAKSMIKFKATGGEPFLTKRIYDFMDHCIKKGYNKNMEVQFTTNGTKMTDSLIAKLRTFKVCSLAFSIDGHDDVYDYIRNPYKFSKLKRNLEKTVNSGIQTDVFITIQILNVFNVFGLTDMINKLGLHIDFIPVYAPDYYDIRILPQAIKEKVNRRIDEYVSGLTNANLIKQYKSMKNHLNGELPNAEKSFEEFKRITKMYDKMRKENLLDLYDYMGDDDEWNISRLVYPKQVKSDE